MCVIVLLCSTPAHLTWSFVAEFADSFRLHGPSEQRTSARQLSSSYRSQIGTNGRLDSVLPLHAGQHMGGAQLRIVYLCSALARKEFAN